MATQKYSLGTRLFVLITFILMVGSNTLSVLMPINGVTVQAASDALPSLFTPAPITFSIWSVIYFLLGAFTLYQLGLFQGSRKGEQNELLNRIGMLFAISSLLNGAWVFIWQYQLVPLSLVVIVAVFLLLAVITNEIKKHRLHGSEVFFIMVPFSVYFGWLTVATIANVTGLLVSLKWDGFGISEQTWTIAILIIGALIGLLKTIKDRDMAYGAVFLWAYYGIWVKHTAANQLAGAYPNVITTLIVCLIVFAVAEVLVLIGILNRRKRGANRHEKGAA